MFVCFSSTDHYFEWNGCNWTNRRKSKYHLYFYSVLVVVVVDVHFFPIHHVHERVGVCTLPISVHATFMYFIKLILLLFSLVSCNFPLFWWPFILLPCPNWKESILRGYTDQVTVYKCTIIMKYTLVQWCGFFENLSFQIHLWRERYKLNFKKK